ncbi:MAG: hypothetical protein V4463_05720 [Pseudomonadota bacterium]
MDEQADKMDARVASLEKDMADVKAELAFQRANLITRVQFDPFATDLAIIRSNYATRTDLARVEAAIRDIRANYASRADLARVEEAIADLRANTASGADLARVEASVAKCASKEELKPLAEGLVQLRTKMDVIEANYVTKQELKSGLDELKSSLLMWIIALMFTTVFTFVGAFLAAFRLLQDEVARQLAHPPVATQTVPPRVLAPPPARKRLP